MAIMVQTCTRLADHFQPEVPSGTDMTDARQQCTIYAYPS